MKETPRPTSGMPEDPDTKLRSTGDSRIVPGVHRPKQRTQPSLGDPENAPGPVAERPATPRD